MVTLKVDQQVIFKQRTARHLAIHSSLSWEYEVGHIVNVLENEVDVVWLQGHHSKNDAVLTEDVCAIFSAEEVVQTTYGSLAGPSIVLHPPVEEGS
jgi:hypothetical protein